MPPTLPSPNGSPRGENCPQPNHVREKLRAARLNASELAHLFLSCGVPQRTVPKKPRMDAQQTRRADLPPFDRRFGPTHLTHRCASVSTLPGLPDSVRLLSELRKVYSVSGSLAGSAAAPEGSLLGAGWPADGFSGSGGGDGLGATGMSGIRAH